MLSLMSYEVGFNLMSFTLIFSDPTHTILNHRATAMINPKPTNWILDLATDLLWSNSLLLLSRRGLVQFAIHFIVAIQVEFP